MPSAPPLASSRSPASPADRHSPATSVHTTRVPQQSPRLPASSPKFGVVIALGATLAPNFGRGGFGRCAAPGGRRPSGRLETSRRNERRASPAHCRRDLGPDPGAAGWIHCAIAHRLVRRRTGRGAMRCRDECSRRWGAGSGVVALVREARLGSGTRSATVPTHFVPGCSGRARRRAIAPSLSLRSCLDSDVVPGSRRLAPG